MKYLSDYIHSKGLKFGMYSSAGYQTCAGYPASFEYEWTDAASFAEWGVDYLKYDYCYHPTNVRPDILYKRMALALANSGRDIVFSACSWGVDNTRQWIKETGAHLWRSTGDIYDGWPNIKMLAQKEMQEMEYNGCGCFNDMDMLVVGMGGEGNVSHTGGCTDEEYLMHFSLWCLWGTPLMMGADIRNVNEYCRSVMLNRELIALNQDPDARAPFYEEKQRYASKARMGLLKFLANGEIVIAYYNFDINPLQVLLYFDDYGIPGGSNYGLELTDILTGENIGVKFDCYNPTLPGRSFKIYKAKFVER